MVTVRGTKGLDKGSSKGTFTERGNIMKKIIMSLTVVLVAVMVTVIGLTAWEAVYNAPYKNHAVRVKVTNTSNGYGYTLKTTANGLTAESWVYGKKWLYPTNEADWVTDNDGIRYYVEVVE